MYPTWSVKIPEELNPLVESVTVTVPPVSAYQKYVFEKFGDDQWLSAIEAAGKLEIKAWF